ncbi:MAG TPA: hypothetical protein VNL71_03575 [Chloroflexota bacterium]|nr:hypothetical protein [Chloroflexota bacterium]
MADHDKSESAAPAPDGGQPAPKPAPTPPPLPAPKLPKGNPIVPVDWKAKAAENPWATYQHSSHVFDVLSAMMTPSYWENVAKATEGAKIPGEATKNVENVFGAALDPQAISMSVKNIWEQNSAQDQIAKWVMEGATAALPPANLAISLDRQVTGASQEQATADVAGQGLAMTANPANALAPEKLLPQMALWSAPDVMTALNSNNPHDATAALTWAAVTGSLLSAGHMGALKGVLSDAMGRWPELEKMLDAVVTKRKQGMTAAQDPAQRLKFFMGALQHPGFEGSVTRKVEAPVQKDIIERVADPKTPGQFIERNVTKENLKAALKAAGAESRSDLVQAITAGRKSTATADALIAHWKELGFNYDLNVVTPAGAPLRNPLPLIEQAAPEIRAKGVRAATAANAYISQMNHGLMVNAESEKEATVSLWRSLLGHSRGTDAVDREGVAALLDLAGHVDGTQLGKAIEGDQAIYDELPHEGKIYVDIHRLISNEERLARQRAGVPYAVGDYLQRMTTKAKNAAKGAGGAANAIASEVEKHRVLAPTMRDVEGEAQIGLTQAYDKVATSNAAMARAKAVAFDQITDFAKPLTKDWLNDETAQAIRQQALNDAPGAMQAALDYTNALFRPFETDAHRILARGGWGHQIKSLHMAQAVEAWKTIKLQVPNPEVDGAKMVATAMHTAGVNAVRDKALREAGYVPLKQGGHDNVLVHPDLAKLIDRATQYGGREENVAVSAALSAETAAMRLIMYQPMVHGWNVGGRFLAFAGMHAATNPVALATHLFGMTGKSAQELRMEAINAGVVNHGKYANFLPEVYKQLGDAMGEQDLYDLPVQAEQVAGHSPEMQDLAKLGKPQGDLYHRAQNLLWTSVDNFATAAYHIEKQAALHSGQTEEQASLWAARRANSWAGYVAPEDSKAVYHDAARMMMFAPAFWRTWGELFVPIYKNSGVAMSHTQALHMAKQEMAIVAATVAVGWATNNAFNMMTSGQPSSTNEPQNRLKLEVRRPEMIRALQAIHYPGADQINAATGYGPNGAVLTVDNPLTRFQKDMGTASGASAHPDYKWTDTVDGLEQFGISRLSPLIEAAAGVMNTDIYQTIHDHQLRSVDPSASALTPTPGSVIAGLTYATPNGSNLVRSVMSSKNNPSAVKLPGGATVPASVMKVLAPMGPQLQALFWQLITATNGPYNSTERTRGIAPSDDEYAKYQQALTTYDTQMKALDAEAAGGTVSPSQWLDRYRTDHTTYSNTTAAYFNQSPEYVNGAGALTNSWEQTYQKATLPDGSLDPSALISAQSDWKATHSNADYTAVQNELTKNDRTYKMLGLYHKTIDNYTKWQESWASQNGYDVSKIRTEAAAYGNLYGDTRASTQYLHSHPDLSAYENAKKRIFDESPAGLMYGLFYSSQTVSNYMRARHLTASQVEQEEEAAP